MGLLFGLRKDDYACASHQFVRELFFEEQGGKCFHCETDMELTPAGFQGPQRGYYFSFDHIFPVSAGGVKRNIRNVIGACQRCNHNRATLEFEEFFDWRTRTRFQDRVRTFSIEKDLDRIHDWVTIKYLESKFITSDMTYVPKFCDSDFTKLFLGKQCHPMKYSV